jgi:hypothetical protein
MVRPCYHLSHLWNVVDRVGCGASWQVAVLSRHTVQAGTNIILFSGGMRSLKLITYFSAEGLGPWRAKPFMGKPAPTEGGGGLSNIKAITTIMHVRVVELLRQAVMGRVPVLEYLVLGVWECLWLCPTRSWLRWCLPDIGDPSGMTARGSGQLTRKIYSGWVGGKIMTVCRYYDGGEDRYRLFPGLILFRLVVPPLQPRVVEPYLVRGTWFPNRLLLKGTDRIQIFGP